jgi:hypothetical protein
MIESLRPLLWYHIEYKFNDAFDGQLEPYISTKPWNMLFDKLRDDAWFHSEFQYKHQLEEEL